MKKLFKILLVISIIIGFAAGIYFYLHKQGFSAAKIFPKGAIAYGRITNVQDNLKKITASPFGQAILDINYEELAEKKIISRKQKDFAQTLKHSLLEESEDALFQKFIGQEVAIAVYPVDVNFHRLKNIKDFFNPALIKELFSGILISFRINPDVQFMEFMLTFLDKEVTDVPLKTEPYKNYTLRTMTIPDTHLEISFIRIKDLLVVGIGEGMVKKAVDVFEENKDFLETDTAFQQAKTKFMSSSEVEGYLDMTGIFSMLQKQTAKLSSFMSKKMKVSESEVRRVDMQLTEFFKKVDGLNILSFSAEWEEIAQQSYSLFFDEEKLDPQIAHIYTCPGTENKTVRFIPENILGYQWNNCFKLDNYWNQKGEELASIDRIKNFETTSGISIERDVVPYFGEELGGYIRDVQMASIPLIGEFPVPDLVFFIEVKSQEKIKNLLDTVSRNPFMMLQEENYKEIPLYYVPSPMGEVLQPGYCFLDKYLLVSTNRKLLKTSIEVYNNSQNSIEQNINFKSFVLGGTEKYRSIQFIKVDQSVQKLMDIFNWGMRWTLQKDRNKLAFRSGINKRLIAVKENIEELEFDLKQMREDMSTIKKHIQSLDAQNLNFKEKEEELAELQKNIQLKQQEINDGYAGKQEQEEILLDYNISTNSSELRQVYLNEIIYPLLGGLESIKAFGSKSMVNEEVIESRLFLQ